MIRMRHTFSTAVLMAACLLLVPHAAADQVILDDLIVDGSACIGFDCVNGESFGFDTLRLKENNLRIHFNDTSSTASFPTQDWGIQINDSSNGGAEYYGIVDRDTGRRVFTIEADAPSHALYVDSGGNKGRLGFGTSTPVTDLHVVSGNTPTLRLEQDGSSGFTAQTWDVAGNEAGFFIRDATNGSTLPFRILPGASSQALVIAGNDEIGIGAGTNPAAKFHIENTSGDDVDDYAVDSDGNLGIGTTSPAAPVDVVRSGGVPVDMLMLTNNNIPQFRFENTNATDGAWRIKVGNNAFFQWDHVATGGNQMELQPNGDVTIMGNLTAAAKPFRIDHPLNPTKQFLQHTAVESPEMMNVYNGNVVLDENGEAEVELAEWFEALNRDFRYQLTPIGGSGPGLYIAEKVSGNRFKIAGGTAGLEVSWQVTGVRHDPWAVANRIPVESWKPGSERGTYLHPEAYGVTNNMARPDGAEQPKAGAGDD